MNLCEEKFSIMQNADAPLFAI